MKFKDVTEVSSFVGPPVTCTNIIIIFAFALVEVEKFDISELNWDLLYVVKS